MAYDTEAYLRSFQQSPEEIANVTASRTNDTNTARAQERLERILAQLEQRQGGLAGAMQPRAVPSRWGPILQRKSPMEKILAALGVGVSAYGAKGARGDVDAGVKASEDYQTKFLGQGQDRIRAIIEAIRARQGGAPQYPDLELTPPGSIEGL